MELVSPNKFFAKSKSRFKKYFPKLRSDKPYILPTRFGLFFSVICLILIYSAFATGNNLMYLYTFFLVSVGFSSLWLTHVNIVDITAENIETEEAFADTPVHATVSINNKAKTRRYFISAQFANSSPQTVEEIQGKATVTLRSSIGSFPRGEHEVPQLTINSTFPFNLLNSWKVFHFSKKFLVYPRPEGNPQLPLSFQQQEAEAGRSVEIVRSPDAEFSGHRKFEDSDSPRHIDWKAFARTEKYLVKDYQGYRPQEVRLDWQKTRYLGNFEKRLSQMALWIEIAESKGFHYSFYFGSTEFPADRGRHHYHRCLKALALAKDEESG